MKIGKYLHFICCPDCREKLIFKSGGLFCKLCKNEYPIIENIPVLLPRSMASDVKLSQLKWDLDYKIKIKNRDKKNLKKAYESTYSEPEFK